MLGLEGCSDLGVSENKVYLYFGVLIIRILLFRVLSDGPLFSETPIWGLGCSTGRRFPGRQLSRLRAKHWVSD